MRQSKLFYKTLKESPIESASHNLLIRAGFINQAMAGAYTFLPLGFKVLSKIENIKHMTYSLVVKQNSSIQPNRIRVELSELQDLVVESAKD